MICVAFGAARRPEQKRKKERFGGSFLFGSRLAAEPLPSNGGAAIAGLGMRNAVEEIVLFFVYYLAFCVTLRSLITTIHQAVIMCKVKSVEKAK